MSLSRSINHPHSTAPDFFENLIISQEPIGIVPTNFREQIVQRRFDWRMFAITVNACGNQTLQTKAAAYARCGSTFCADARFSRKMQRDRTPKGTHEEFLG